MPYRDESWEAYLRYVWSHRRQAAITAIWLEQSKRWTVTLNDEVRECGADLGFTADEMFWHLDNNYKRQCVNDRRSIAPELTALCNAGFLVRTAMRRKTKANATGAVILPRFLWNAELHGFAKKPTTPGAKPENVRINYGNGYRAKLLGLEPSAAQMAHRGFRDGFKQAPAVQQKATDAYVMKRCGILHSYNLP